MSCARFVTAAALVAILLVGYRPNSRAVADENASDKPRVYDFTDFRASRDSIERKLKEPVDFKFRDVPVTQVLEEVVSKHKVRIVFDRVVLHHAAKEPTSCLVAVELKGTTLRAALDLILSENGLAAVPQGDVIKITTKEDAERILETLVYGVVDLVEIETHADPHCDKLIDLITGTVDTETWSDLGGPGTINGWNGMLTVSQTSATQHKVEELLATLRETRKQQAGGKISKVTFLGGVQPLATKLEKLLALPTTLNFRDATLADVLVDLKDRVGIDFQLDKPVLTDAGKDPTSELVTFSVRDATARTAIDLMFDQLGLTWIYKHEVPLITTTEEAANQLLIGVYPIADLAGPHSQTETEKKLEFLEGDAEALLDLITGSVETATWSELGGPGTIEPFDAEYPVLVISQTSKVHQAIGVLLEDLRRTRRAQAEELAKHATQPVQPPAMVIQTYALRPGDQNVPPVPPKEIALLIKALTGPKIWNQEEAFIQGFTGKLIVKHTPGVQRQVRKILQEIEVLSVPQGGFGAGGMGGSGSRGGGGF